MHPLGLLLSITFRTILAAHRAPDTFATRRTENRSSCWSELVFYDTFIFMESIFSPKPRRANGPPMAEAAPTDKKLKDAIQMKLVETGEYDRYVLG
eukprot:scaffold920_cov135-Isochrysis_galbana.AAC.6